jgi:TetR/AcrR family transcriptional regulator, fatty acid metabolism regulator protein
MIPEIFATDPSWTFSKAKTAVLAAASIVIREDGPRAGTLKNIATKAGITEPAIFRHFDGVDGLFGGLFTVFERIYERSFAAFDSDELRGLAKLRAMGANIAACLSSSRDFAYILIYARHVFRGYPELRAKVSECDVRGENLVLDCVNEAIKAGDLRSDLDPVSIATSFIGALYITSIFWIESGFAFDIREVYADRMDDCIRMVAAKPAAKSREAKAATRERNAYFPLRPIAAPRGKSGSAKPRRGSSAGKADASRKPAKAAKTAKPASKAAKSAPKRAIAAKVAVKKPTIRSK